MIDTFKAYLDNDKSVRKLKVCLSVRPKTVH